MEGVIAAGLAALAATGVGGAQHRLVEALLLLQAGSALI
jgi:hypothetical protein